MTVYRLLVLSRFNRDSQGCPFLFINIYFDKMGDADNINPFFEQVTTSNSNRFHCLIDCPCTDSLHFRFFTFAYHASDGASYSRTASISASLRTHTRDTSP